MSRKKNETSIGIKHSVHLTARGTLNEDGWNRWLGIPSERPTETQKVMFQLHMSFKCGFLLNTIHTNNSVSFLDAKIF